MNEKLLQLIREVLGLEENAEVSDESAAAFLKKHAKPAYQAIFDDGHGVAMAQQQKTIDRLTGEKVALQAEFDRVKADLTTALKDKPDLAALQEQIDEKDAEIEALKQQNAADKRDAKIEATVEKLRAKLAPKLNEGYEEILVDRKSTRELFSFDEEGNFRILRPGKTTPFAGDENAQLDSLTAELLKDVKPVFKRSDVGAGSGTGSDTGGDGKTKAAIFDEAREEAKKAGGESAVDAAAELNRRLGLGSPA